MTYTQNDFNDGATFYVTTDFFKDANNTVKFDVTRISIYVFGSGNYDLEFVPDATYGYKIVMSKQVANEIRDEIIRVFKLMDEKKPETDWIRDPFKVDNYGKYWNIEVYYNLSIKDGASGDWGAPSENFVTSAKNKDAWIDN